MLAKEIREDAIEVFGRCDGPKLLGKVSSAVEMLRNESLWDATLGMMDLQSLGKSNYLTLPRDVETPLAIQLDGVPAFPRNRWFQFHLNGSGACTQMNAFKRFWDDLGDVVTIFDPTHPFKLHVEFDDAEDHDAQIVVQGYNENGLEVRATREDWDNITWKKIIRITKDPTMGIVRLFSIQIDYANMLSSILETGLGVYIDENDPSYVGMIGLYYPDEEEIRYRRIRVPKCTRIRMNYRRIFDCVRSWEDYIPLNSKFALKNAMQAVKYMDSGDLAQGNAYRMMAVDLANKEQKQRNPRAAVTVQINTFGQGRNKSLWGNRGARNVGWGRHG